MEGSFVSVAGKGLRGAVFVSVAAKELSHSENGEAGLAMIFTEHLSTKLTKCQ